MIAPCAEREALGISPDPTPFSFRVVPKTPSLFNLHS